MIADKNSFSHIIGAPSFSMADSTPLLVESLINRSRGVI
jgi:hypothetical protein